MKKNNLMKNKFLLSIFIAVFVIVSLGSVFAEDIGYVLKDTTSPNQEFISSMNELNYTYKLIDDSNVLSTNFGNYKLILIGDESIDNVPLDQYKSMIVSPRYYENWSKYIGNSGSSQPLWANNTNSQISITKELQGEFQAYTKGGTTISMYYLNGIKYGLEKVTSKVEDQNKFVIAVKQNPRRVFFGITKSEYWTDDSKQLFKNSLVWIINGEDRDQDGFYSDLDCNDNNPQANPNGIEIPYDGIDQNCDGTDLNDLDEDGFVAEIAGGNDCNDNDSTYNINSTNLAKNCVNDAPIIKYLSDIYVQETQNVEITVSAEDPENDSLTYAINDSRFVQEENYFVWETEYTDAGYYTFNITVSDGEFESYREVGVRVREKNKAPEFIGEILTQEWQEDTNHSLNLSQYFYDLDGDTLYYMIDSTSSDLNITVFSIQNGTAHFTVKKDWYGEDWIIFKVTDLGYTQKTNNITLRVLPVNDAPVLLEEIGTITTDEDEIYYLDLNEYFKDVDSELTYEVSGNTFVQLNLVDNILEIIPPENLYGEDEFQVTASDGEFEIMQDANIEVVSVNDAPVVQTILDIFVLAGQLVEITASATDVEGDNFNFSINDSRFVQADENYFEWQTSDRDFGVYNFKIGAYDDNSYGYSNAKVNVLQKVLINEFVWGAEGWVELYNPENTSFDLGNCALDNGEDNLVLSGTLGNKGFAAFDWNALKNQGYIELTCSNVLIDRVEYEEFNNQNSLGRTPDGSSNPFSLYVYPTKGVSNSADITKPQVELNSPENNTLYTETRDVLFEFTAKDNMAEELECSIFTNSKFLEKGDFENNTLGSFYIDYLQDGVYLWNVECSDGTNKNSALESWMVNISAPDAPTLNYIGNKVVSENNELRFSVFATDQDGNTIELSALDIPEGAVFTDNENGNGVFIWKPNYNQSGTYTVKFIAEDSTGLEDSETITILVGNTKEPPKFTDADICSDKNSSIEISIRDPDNGDDFEIGDIINGTVKIKNNLDDSRDFDVRVYLYDTKEEQSIEEFKESIDINDGKSGEIEFSIEIPDDIDETGEFAIYAYVESDEDECNSNYVDIEINRKKHEVIIGEIKIDKEEVSPGDELEIKVKAENLGREDEEIFFVVEIPSLSISGKSEAIDIEKYGDDDSETKTFTILIPDNAPEGIYQIKASVIFDDGQDSEVKEFTLTKGVQSQQTQTTNQVQQNGVISLSSSSQGKQLTVGDSSSTISTTPTGSTLNLGGSSTPSTTNTVTGSTTVLRSRSSSSSLGSKLTREKETLSLGITEKTQKEYTPNVKVEFNDAQNKFGRLGDGNSWVLLAVVLGLLVIMMFILIIRFV